MVHEIDDRDREAARDAYDRVNVKAALAHEIIVESLITHALDEETPYSDKLAIARELKDITATTERAKRQIAAEGGSRRVPVINFNFPDGHTQTIETAEVADEQD